MSVGLVTQLCLTTPPSRVPLRAPRPGAQVQAVTVTQTREVGSPVGSRPTPSFTLIATPGRR